ncbi:hypothetical protein ILUMI_00119 [Ignelater luminosus]|uniref:Uncharacterized protein n=1 Tax=Ignelater luminosus TaxID=2038154 RepID=A0A8K0DKU9_IGNLU|nr:hypothetical protein ILUMI_00119 [Ignelater luminosus]
MIESNDVKEIQIKIKRQIEELEEKVKNSKTYWNHGDLKFDKQFVENFIESHYNEIVHHLNQIKHHLEKVNYHKKEIEDIQVYLTHDADLSSPEILNDSDEHIEDKTPKRAEEDKLRFKSRRLARSTSLKYVLQWEKMLDEQKEENAFNVIKRRSKNATHGTDLENSNSEEADVSKIMVKNRVLQFEGIQKPKRISSTYETFLDFSGDKPKRVKSYPILEELEDDNEPERPKSCTLDNSTNGFEDAEQSFESNLKQLKNNEEMASEVNLEAHKHEDGEIVKDEEECSNTAESKHLIEETHVEAEVERKCDDVEAEVERKCDDVEAEIERKCDDQTISKEENTTLQNNTSEGSSRKPRIVEVHLKKPYLTEINSQIPLT